MIQIWTTTEVDFGRPPSPRSSLRIDPDANDGLSQMIHIRHGHQEPDTVRFLF